MLSVPSRRCFLFRLGGAVDLQYQRNMVWISLFKFLSKSEIKARVGGRLFLKRRLPWPRSSWGHERAAGYFTLKRLSHAADVGSERASGLTFRFRRPTGSFSMPCSPQICRIESQIGLKSFLTETRVNLEERLLDSVPPVEAEAANPRPEPPSERI